jgi:hypothetical protein
MLIILFVCSTLLFTGCTDDEVSPPMIAGSVQPDQPAATQTATPVEEIDPDFLEQFYGVWYSKSEQGIVLTIDEHHLSIGYDQGDIISEQIFEITEANEDHQYLIVSGDIEDVMLGEDSAEQQNVKFHARLTLQNDAETLLYDNQYLGEQIITEWQRTPVEGNVSADPKSTDDSQDDTGADFDSEDSDSNADSL